MPNGTYIATPLLQAHALPTSLALRVSPPFQCASAIAQANFAEYIFATAAPDLVGWGWPQISIRSLEVFERATEVQKKQVTRIVQGVLREETDQLFQWQWQLEGICPPGCARDNEGSCVQAGTGGEHDEL
jgi:tRNA(Arg) A34 adenosine deaminase TadA